MKQNKVREVQEYLHHRGIDTSEVAIIDAAIRIATRYSGKYAFVREFTREKDK